MNDLRTLSALTLGLGHVLIAATPALAASGDEHWDAQFGWPGTTNIVYAIATHAGRLYTGGTSGYAGVTNTTLNVWDGARWSGLGLFGGGATPLVYDLAFVGDTLYAAGSFREVDGVPTSGLARWNGNAWSSVGLLGTALALAVEGSDLYVGGAFTNVGGVAATNVARWDGSAWHALGDGLGTNAFNYVRTLAVSNGVVYAGGYFNNSGAQFMTNIARWNGAAWTALGSGVNSDVFSVALLGADVYAAGLFTMAGGGPASRIARWDGAAWSALGSGLNDSVGSLAVLGNRLCVAGNFTTAGGISASRFAVWDGVSWAATGGLGNAAARVISTGTNVYVGGGFLAAGTVLANEIATWDGTNWGSIGRAGYINGMNVNVRSLAISGNDVYAGGVFDFAGQTRTFRVARFDGTNWFALGAGMRGTNGGTTMVSALAVSGSDVYAGGIFTNAGGITASNIARWDGANWFPLAAGVPGSVAAIAVRGSDVFVGGNFTLSTASGTAFNIARWDGVVWSRLPGASFLGTINNFFVNAIAIQGNDVYVGGSFFAGNFSGQTTTNLARHDGTDWMPVGGGVNSNVNAIAIAGGQVYVGGRFSSAGGVPANRIARWDGASWSALGGGVSGTGNYSVSALAVLGSDLFAGGNFTNASGLDVNRIARWDGTNWSALGGGITRVLGTPAVGVLAASGTDLYVGGGFEFAGGKPSYYVARWNETRDFDFVPTLRLLDPQRRPSGYFSFTLTSSGVPAYVIEATTNFTGWTPLQTNTATPNEFWDFSAPGRSHRFYRARPWP